MFCQFSLSEICLLIVVNPSCQVGKIAIKVACFLAKLCSRCALNAAENLSVIWCVNFVSMNVVESGKKH